MKLFHEQFYDKKHATFWLRVHEELKKPLPLYAIGKHLQVMLSTGPMMLNRVSQRHKTMIATLPSHLFMAYSSNDDFTKIKKGDAILYPLNGQSWNSWDSKLFNFVNKNQSSLIMILLKVCKLENYKDAFLINLNDQSSRQHEITFYLKNLNPSKFSYLKKMNYIQYSINERDVDHRYADGYKLIRDIFQIDNEIEKMEDYFLFFYLPIISTRLLLFYIYAYLRKSKLEKNPIAIQPLMYQNNILSKSMIKKKMSQLKITHVSSFLIALYGLAYHHITKKTQIKCKIIYHLPWMVGNNKFFPDYVIIDIIDPSIEGIYRQVVKNRKSLYDMWGIYVWIKTIDYILEKSNESIISSNIQNNIDICFSNIPDNFDIDQVELSINRESMKIYTVFVSVIKTTIFLYLTSITMKDLNPCIHVCLN